MAVTEKEVLYSSVSALSIKVNWTHIFYFENGCKFVPFKENWQSSHSLPDMRLLIIEPSVLKNESLKRLQDVGWGLCRVPRLEYMKVLWFIRAAHRVNLKCKYITGDHHAILRCIWEAVCLEHDPVRGGPLAGQWHSGCEEPPTSAEPGLEAVNAREHWQGSKVIFISNSFESRPDSLWPLTRIGATWSTIWWNYFLINQQAPPPGHKNHQTNTGIFMIRPGDYCQQV